MNDAEQKNTRIKNGSWENELWSLIDNSDGINCPLLETCQYKDNTNICLNINKDYTDALQKYLDSDILVTPPFYDFPKFPKCMVNDKLFVLITKLAEKWAKKLSSSVLPVPVDVIPDICHSQPVEIRLVPLNSAHGAVWRLKDAWVIHLNSKDSSARRRFTLFHEVFHILAHCNSEPVFKKIYNRRNGDFNEMLADFFSGMIILPYEMMRKKWQEIKDVKKMAAVFDVPETVMYCGLKWTKLIK